MFDGGVIPRFRSRVWLSKILLTCRNPDHRQIHLNFVHRIYLAPRRLCATKLLNSPYCTLCTWNAVGTFFHTMWKCSEALEFWRMVARKLSFLLSTDIVTSPATFLWNDASMLRLNRTQKRVFFAGLTAAEKMVATRWKTPHALTFHQRPLT